jgi:hypothetical protein
MRRFNQKIAMKTVFFLKKKTQNRNGLQTINKRHTDRPVIGRAHDSSCQSRRRRRRAPQ